MWTQIQNTGKGGYGGRLTEKLDDYIDQAGKLEELTDRLYDCLLYTSGKIQCAVTTGKHALNTFNGIVDDLLVCGSRFFELIRLDILFRCV